MTTDRSITQAATVYVAVTDQERALAFYAGTLGFETRSDFPYADGERWIEVVPPGAVTSLTLLPAERRAARRRRDRRRAERPRTPPRRTPSCAPAASTSTPPSCARAIPSCTGPAAVLAGIPPMFRFRDPDGNSFLLGEGP